MAIPSPVKIKKNGVEYISNVDRVNYTFKQLVKAALKETGKLIRKRTRQGIHKRTGNLARWVKAKVSYNASLEEHEVQIGFVKESKDKGKTARSKSGGKERFGFYGAFQELGTSKEPARPILKPSALNNISEIRTIQGKFLSAIENESKALGLIDEGDDIDDND
jgi:HK97 gp10 family phage protein